MMETVVAFTVLLLLTLAILSLAPSSLLSLGRAHHQIVASNLAQSLLEQQRAKAFTDLTPGGPSALTAVPLDDGVKLNPTLTIATTSSSEARLVRVTVRWDERSGTCETFRESIVARINR